MTVSDNTIQAKCLSGFFKNLGKKGLNVSKSFEKLGRALEFGPDVGTAITPRKPKAA